MIRRNSVVIFAVLLAAISCAGALAQTYEVWVGRPTVGDYIRRDIARIITAVGETTKSKVQMNAEIAEGRRRFLATASDPSNRAAAAEKYAELLWAKDITYMSLYVSQGFTEENLSIIAGLDSMTGGPLDSGIPADAWNSFVAWVNGVRTSLGASSTSAPVYLMPGDVEKLQQALDANEELYVAYVQRRDLAEIEAPARAQALAEEMARSAEMIADAKAADGSAVLDEQVEEEFGPLHWEAYIGPLDTPLREALQGTRQSGQKILKCTYGPLALASGQPGYSVYEYWLDTPPPNTSQLLTLGRGLSGNTNQRAFAIMIGRATVRECPQSASAAEGIAETAFLAATGQPSQPASPQPERNAACGPLDEQLAAARAGATDAGSLRSLERSYARYQCGG